MFYQLFSIISAILAPATICLLVAGWCYFCVWGHKKSVRVNFCSVVRPAGVQLVCLFYAMESKPFYQRQEQHVKFSPLYVALVLCPPGSLAFILNIHSAAALVMSVIPPAIYLGLCFKLKADTQITIAAVLSVMYAFLMLVVTMSIIGKLCSNGCNFMQARVLTLFGLCQIFKE